MFITEEILVSTLIEPGSDPLPSPPAGQEASPEAVRSIGLDGVIASSQQGHVIPS